MMNRSTRLGLLALCLGLGFRVAGEARGQVTARKFEETALPALAVEESYDFHRQLTEGIPPRPRDPDARPTADEVEIGEGWSVEVPADASAPLVAAAEELRRYMKEAMRVDVALKRPAKVDGWRDRPKTIVAAPRDAMADLGEPLKASKDYRIAVADDAVAVCGFDDRGAAYGLYNLIMRFSLREAPCLPRKLDTIRHSLYQARMTVSGMGWMEWPDRYLATLPLYGFDAIHCSIYRNPNNAPGAEPYWGDDVMRKHEPGVMKDLVRRAARFGIDVYAPILYKYTGEPENVEGLRKLVREVVTEFPEIRGYVLLTEGFFYKNWFGAGGQGDEDLRAWAREWAKGVAVVAEEAHKINPRIEILPWEYNIAFSPDQVDTKAYVMTQLPESSIPLMTFENGKGFELDGQKGYLRDYAISQVGPAEVTQAQLRTIRGRKFRAAYSKADTFASWQFGTFPYLPFPYQWHERYKALQEWKIDGTLESWTYGFKPNWVAEMRAWYCWSDAPPLDDLLRQIARRDFGAGSEDDVLAAWKSFSEAIRVYPDTGPNWGSNNAVAAPLFFEQPTEDRPLPTTYDHSWTRDARSAGLNSKWPYTVARLVFWPDFSNQADAARSYIGFFTVPVFQKYLKLAADRMEQGLQSYRAAALRAPEAKRTAAFREVMLAEQLQRMMRSEHAIIDFDQKRMALAKSADPAERRELLSAMTDLLREEKERTTSSLETARRDSRLGYEWEQDYVYTPEIIRHKLDLIDATLDRQVPAFRREHGLEEGKP